MPESIFIKLLSIVGKFKKKEKRKKLQNIANPLLVCTTLFHHFFTSLCPLLLMRAHLQPNTQLLTSFSSCIFLLYRTTNKICVSPRAASLPSPLHAARSDLFNHASLQTLSILLFSKSAQRFFSSSSLCLLAALHTCKH